MAFQHTALGNPYGYCGPGPDNDIPAQRAGLLRCVVVCVSGIGLDWDESDSRRRHPALRSHVRNQQYRLAWTLHSLHRWTMDHAGGPCLDVLLPTLGDKSSPVQPSTLVTRLLDARVFLSVRWHAPLHFQSDPVSQPDDFDCHQHDAHHPRLGGHYQSLWYRQRALGCDYRRPGRGQFCRQVFAACDVLLFSRLLPGIDRSTAPSAGTHAFHRLRYLSFAFHRIRHLCAGCGGQHVLRLATGHGTRSMER